MTEIKGQEIYVKCSTCISNGQALLQQIQLVGNRLSFHLCEYSKVVQEQERGRGREESGGMKAGREGERESARIYSMQAVGFCSQSHLDWEASFPTGEEWRRTDMATDDKEEQRERTGIVDQKQRELDIRL